MANTKISALTANTNPNWSEEFVYAYNNANGKITLNTMKAFVWWAGVTTLNADANIWELTDGIYETEHLLYYKSGENIPSSSSSSAVWKQMLFVTTEASWARAFFGFNTWHISWTYIYRASYWYSLSASEWGCNMLWSWDASLQQYDYLIGSNLSHPDGITNYSLTQVINNIDDSASNALNISASNPPYPWVTYTILINSVKSWETYSITLWDWVTNPLNITLPTSSNKKCVITLLITSSTSAIITWCTMAS